MSPRKEGRGREGEEGEEGGSCAEVTRIWGLLSHARRPNGGMALLVW